MVLYPEECSTVETSVAQDSFKQHRFYNFPYKISSEKNLTEDQNISL